MDVQLNIRSPNSGKLHFQGAVGSALVRIAYLNMPGDISVLWGDYIFFNAADKEVVKGQLANITLRDINSIDTIDFLIDEISQECPVSLSSSTIEYQTDSFGYSGSILLWNKRRYGNV